MERRRFAIFILSHGRADKIHTVKTMQKCGYTGEWYIILDDEDDTIGEYKKRYGDERIIVFSKEDVAQRIDEGDNFADRRCILYARNAAFDIAEKLGITHFLQLDDDYKDFQYRYVDGGKCKTRSVNLDKVIPLYLDFLDNTDSLTIAFGQGGDMIGGKEAGNFKKPIARKAMNSFFCRTKKRILFVGRINEDVNMYVCQNLRGEKIFTYMPMMLVQKQTQQESGGMTEMYLDGGTYKKSFYSVMYAPSCVSIRVMGVTHRRIHHRIAWEHCSPMILQECWKKKRAEVQRDA